MTYSPAREVHDELHVKSLVLDNGITRLAFAVVDSCMVPGDIIAKAKRLIQDHTSIPPANVLVSATHTHSAPAATHLFQSEPDPKYVEFLTTRIADSVRIAVERLEPARIGWGIGREERLLFCRRYYMKPGSIPPNPFGKTTERVQMNPPSGSPNILKPEGPIDPDVGVIAVESLQGRPICVIGNYALHYVGGVGRGHLSADYFACWADSMTRLAGLTPRTGFPPFVGILTNACSGHGVSSDHRVAQKALPTVREDAVGGRSACRGIVSCVANHSVSKLGRTERQSGRTGDGRAPPEQRRSRRGSQEIECSRLEFRIEDTAHGPERYLRA
jgi:hypothetical protein